MHGLPVLPGRAPTSASPPHGRGASRPAARRPPWPAGPTHPMNAEGLR
ncbi:MAG TPA: hypothetical protein VHF47_13280 [Acidimicrobiales bacterium]|nr:hypothetical protein [Acidimicrobiales bacterium]